MPIHSYIQAAADLMVEMTPSQRVLQALGLLPQDIAEQLGMRPSVVEAFLHESRIHEGPASSWRRGDGIPRPFARLLALHLGIHRAFLADPQSGHVPMPINLMGDLPDALNGVFGRIAMAIGEGGQAREGATISASIFASTASEWMSPLPGQAIGFITNGMDGFIVFPDTLSAFTCERHGSGSGRVPVSSDPFNPDLGINPEVLLGIFDLQELAGGCNLLDPDLRLGLRGDMMPEYVATLQSFLKAMGPDRVISALNAITVIYKNGHQRTLDLGPSHNPVLSGIYRFIRDGRVPPFLMLGDREWMEGIPMEKIAAIRFPWPMIARYGAHVDIDTALADGQRVPTAGKNTPDILVATHDMLPREKLETA